MRDVENVIEQEEKPNRLVELLIKGMEYECMIKGGVRKIEKAGIIEEKIEYV